MCICTPFHLLGLVWGWFRWDEVLDREEREWSEVFVMFACQSDPDYHDIQLDRFIPSRSSSVDPSLASAAGDMSNYSISGDDDYMTNVSMASNTFASNHQPVQSGDLVPTASHHQTAQSSDPASATSYYNAVSTAPLPKGRPKMVPPGMDASRIDEEGTPDVWRNLIDKLKRHITIDQPVEEPLSMELYDI